MHLWYKLLTDRALALLLLCLVCVFGANACFAQTHVRKCVAADGSVSYVDAQICPGEAQGSERVIPEHRVTLTPNEEMRLRQQQSPTNSGTDLAQYQRIQDSYRRASADAQRASTGDAGTARPNSATSYQCSAADGIWYSHNPCPSTIGGGPVLGRDEFGRLTTYETSGVPVKQKAVPRSVACDEISSAHAMTRPGRQLDQSSNPYDKLNGKDPCS